MIQTISFSQFCDGFSGSYKNNFSYYGKQALFNYLQDYEEDTGENIDFDPIALCCDFTEYESLEEIKKNYNDIETLEDLQDNTTVIEFNEDNEFMKERTSGIIIQDF